MKLTHCPVRIVALVSLVSASLAALAGELPLASDAVSERFETRVLAVDSAKHQVTIEGLDKRPVALQLTDQAKAARNLQVGDKVDMRITRSIDYVLDTRVEGAPSVSNDAWVNRADPAGLPGGELYSTVKVTSKITHIDPPNHRVTVLKPDGNEQVITVNDPKGRALIPQLQVGQTVDAIHTEVLKVETSR
ncbi:hypothetical protein DV532_14735 [Pseudomonas sp. Leaf58]|uniref:hypothetical protein n=1 Tax=Pseudomonas sp. Leaf58 TaxID=1736226 RepID=UPI0006FE9A07|nr:hypothetical protein [Pseudomonas sp. Leaf58]AYG45479.1 hypothetical protein DV532_14735 [Pseudomonas sp. Leaf58]KQN61594.1 hypothetical protein ASF02_14590 [Pseudomonas sp. Leaf58]